MKQNKNFLNALDDWGAVLTNIYEDATKHTVHPVKNEDGDLVVPANYTKKLNKIKGTVVIPYGVTKILHNAFSDCIDMYNIEIPATVNFINIMAFMGCRNLQEITIPDGVDSILKQTFIGCSSLKKVKFPNMLNKIQSEAFSNCDLTGDLVIPNGTKTIGMNAFLNNKNLTSLKLNDELLEIDLWAFKNCTGLVGELVIPKNVHHIGTMAFEGTNLAKIYVPSNMVDKWNKNWNGACPAEIIYY